MIGHRPADHAPAVGVQHHRQIDEALGQPDVRDVGHPQLVGGRRHQPAGQVRVDLPAMPAVGGRRHERLLAQAQQIVLAQQPQHPLVVHRPALTPQERPQPAVAIVPVRQRQAAAGDRAAPSPPPPAPTPASGDSSWRGWPRAARTSAPRSARLAAAPRPGRGRRRRRVGRHARRSTHLLHELQGLPEKIQLQRLLADLALQGRDPRLRPGQLIRHGHAAGATTRGRASARRPSARRPAAGPPRAAPRHRRVAPCRATGREACAAPRARAQARSRSRPPPSAPSRQLERPDQAPSPDFAAIQPSSRRTVTHSLSHSRGPLHS